ncbi:MAG: hemerythrin domain-containing protein, partial [Chloroflexota bacterium]
VLWAQLADFLEVHAEAEELHFYPALLRRGEGAGDKPDAKSETFDAIKDHNEIRDAIAKVGAHAPGGAEWYQAVAAARKANSDHMAEEERQGLADFRQHAPLQTRHDLGVRFATFEARHRMGVHAQDKDPRTYIQQHA